MLRTPELQVILSEKSKVWKVHCIPDYILLYKVVMLIRWNNNSISNSLRRPSTDCAKMIYLLCNVIITKIRDHKLERNAADLRTVLAYFTNVSNKIIMHPKSTKYAADFHQQIAGQCEMRSLFIRRILTKICKGNRVKCARQQICNT